MEIALDKMNKKGTTLWNDSSHRLKSRPSPLPSCSPGKGRAFEDFGSTWPKKKEAEKTKGRFTGTSSKPVQRDARSGFGHWSSDSEDELSLRPNLQRTDASSSTRPVSEDQHAREEDASHDVRYIDLTRPPYKFPFKFTKIKSTGKNEAEAVDPPPPSSSLISANSQDSTFTAPHSPIRRAPRIAKPVQTLDTMRSLSPADGENTARTRTSKRIVTRSGTQAKDYDVRSKVKAREEPSPERDIAPTRPKVKPRRVTKVHNVYDEGDIVVSTPAYKPRPIPVPKQSLMDISDNDKHADGKASKAGRTVRGFPMNLSPAEGGNCSTAENAKAASKRKPPQREISLPSPLSFQAQVQSKPRPRPVKPPKDMLPLSSPPSKHKENAQQKENLLKSNSGFPTLSPLRSPTQERYSARQKGKGRAVSEAQGDDEDDDQSRARARPFPMSMHVLKSIKRTSSPGDRPSPFGDSSDDSDMDSERSRKRRRAGESTALPQLYAHNFSTQGEDSLFMDVDPSTICPYCDEPLPAIPTKHLINMLETTKRKSYPAPRVSNPRGLRAVLAVYISVCQRHRFETYHLPMAQSRGWPQEIDFKEVPARVESLRQELEAIILDCDSGAEPGDDFSRGPRGCSVFWREMMKEVKKQGSRAVAGVKGQFESFEKTQPGYYGELGSVIIHQTLYSLFPPSSFDPYLISPLTPAEFIQRILVPEAAAALIMEDLDIAKDEAVKTLRESAQYGVAMFPDADTGTGPLERGGDDDEDMGVADQIVMERARVRRMELEVEERIEEQMLKEEQASRKAREKQAKTIERKKSRAQQRQRDSSDEDIYVPRPTRNKRVPTAERSLVTTGSESDGRAMTSDTSGRSTRSNTRRSQAKATAPRKMTSSSDRDVISESGSETVEVVSHAKPKLRLRHVTPPEKMVVSLEEDVEIMTSTPRRQGDEDPTPRPRRVIAPNNRLSQPRELSTIDVSNPMNFFPLQTARQRIESSNDEWQTSLRQPIPDEDEGSERDEPEFRRPPSTRQQRQKNGSSWLLSDSSTSDVEYFKT